MSTRSQWAPLAVATLALVVLACGSGQEKPSVPAEEPADAGLVVSAPATAEASDEAKLRAAQNVGCEGMCEKLTECAVADAKATMTPEQLEDLKLEQTAPRNTQECTNECEGPSLSVRQVAGMHACLREFVDCDTFKDCLTAVSKGS